MKRIKVIFTALLLVSVSTLLAQDAPKKGQKLEKLRTELNLSDAQSASLKAIFNESRKDMRTIKQNESLSKEAKKEQMKEVRGRTDAKIQSVLDAEQFARFNEIKAERKAEAKAKRDQKREAYLDEIGLTKDQKVRLLKVKEDSKTRIKSVKQDTSLTDEEKKAQVKQIRAEADEELKQILTTEQYKSLKAKKKEMKEKKKAKRTPKAE